MTDLQYFKPTFDDFYEGAVYYEKLPHGQHTFIKRYSVLAWSDVLINKSLEIRETVYMKYLDGDQIEAFGFIRINIPPWGYGIAISNPEIQWFNKGQWFISFSPKYRNIGIFQFDAVRHGQYLNFSGEIRDINRFKLIVDWIIISFERRAAEEVVLQQNQLTYGNNKKKEDGSDSLQIGEKR